MELTEYDYIVINSSGGKDSQAMTDVVCRLADLAGIPKEKIVVVHADLAEVEWPGCKELAAEHAAHYGVRFECVKHKKGSLLDYVRRRWLKLKSEGKDAAPWPSPQQRWCTSDLKRGPIRTLFTRLAAEHRAKHGKRARARILNCMGMRSGESCARAKLVPYEHCESASNGRRHVDDWLPIFDWSADQVWVRIREVGTRHHHAYDLGMPRLSCCFCIYAPESALMLAGQHNRELLDEYVKVEQETGKSFKMGLKLADVRDRLERGERAGEVKTWEM